MRPTQLGQFRLASAWVVDRPELLHEIETIFVEFDHALDQAHQSLLRFSDAMAKCLQEHAAGNKLVKLTKVCEEAQRDCRPRNRSCMTG